MVDRGGFFAFSSEEANERKGQKKERAAFCKVPAPLTLNENKGVRQTHPGIVFFLCLLPHQGDQSAGVPMLRKDSRNVKHVFAIFSRQTMERWETGIWPETLSTQRDAGTLKTIRPLSHSGSKSAPTCS